MNRQILHARRDELESQLRAIHAAAGDRALTSAEEGRWNRLEAELREVRDHIEKVDAADAEAARITDMRARWGSLKVDEASAPQYAGTDVARMDPRTVRDAARRILDDTRSSGHLTPAQGDHVAGMLDTRSPSLDGEWIARAIALTETPVYRSALQQVLFDEHPVLSGAEAEALRAYREFRAASIGTDAAGGFGVQALLDPTIILAGQQSANPVRAIARTETITTSEWKGVATTGATWSWDAEAEEVSDDTPTLTQPTVATHTARGFIPYSLEVGMDYPNFASEFSRILAEGFDELLAEALITGSGSGQPYGILTVLDANTNVEVVVTTDGTFSSTDIDKVWTALPDRAKGNATWLMSTDVESYIALWGDAYGGRTTDLAGNVTTLRGRPHVTSSYMPAFTGTTGAANICVVGDFKKYLVAFRAGLAVEPVRHLFGTTNGRPTGQRGLFAWGRVGANSVDDLAFRVLQNQ